MVELPAIHFDCSIEIKLRRIRVGNDLNLPGEGHSTEFHARVTYDSELPVRIAVPIRVKVGSVENSPLRIAMNDGPAAHELRLLAAHLASQFLLADCGFQGLI